MKPEEILKKIRENKSNIHFADLQKLVEAFGFHLKRVKGSHHIYQNSEIPEFINLQPDGKNAKPYQINQFLKIVERYGLKL